VLCFLQAPIILPHETLTTTVLFDREIVRILNNRCVMCHTEKRPGIFARDLRNKPGSRDERFERR
jgi:hypothetical protein